jgi:hypothetical protein
MMEKLDKELVLKRSKMSHPKTTEILVDIINELVDEINKLNGINTNTPDDSGDEAVH